MIHYPRYRLRRDYITPVETIPAGTTREVIDWLNTFPGLSEYDFTLKSERYKEWFEEESQDVETREEITRQIQFRCPA